MMIAVGLMGVMFLILGAGAFLEQPSYKAFGVVAGGMALLTLFGGSIGLYSGDDSWDVMWRSLGYAAFVGLAFFSVPAGLVAAGRLFVRLWKWANT